jgi:hypothetical protein
LVRLLTAGEAQCSEEYIARVFASGRTNAHQRQKRRAHREIYQSLVDWQRHFFDAVLEETGIEEGYGALGYDFGFRA